MKTLLYLVALFTSIIFTGSVTAAVLLSLLLVGIFRFVAPLFSEGMQAHSATRRQGKVNSKNPGLPSQITMTLH